MLRFTSRALCGSVRRHAGSILASVNSAGMPSSNLVQRLPAQPGLVVDGLGPISLPLTDAQAEQLVSVCELAPHGRGTRTILDTSVRHTFQLAPGRMRFTNPAWEPALEETVADAAEALGLKRDAVRCRLYKLLLYEEGCFFKPHMDTEKEPGMFATLSVQLPSVFSGGRGLVRHNEKTCSYALGAKDGTAPYACHSLVHFADCTHEVEPITSGRRLVAIYSLCWASAQDASQHERNANEQRISELAKALEAVPAAERSFALHLEHAYTTSSLGRHGIGALKGADRARLHALQSASDNQLACHLAVVGAVDMELGDATERALRLSIEEVFAEDGSSLFQQAWTIFDKGDNFSVAVDVNERSVEKLIAADRCSESSSTSYRTDSLYLEPPEWQAAVEAAAAELVGCSSWEHVGSFFAEWTGNEGARGETTYKHTFLLATPTSPAHTRNEPALHAVRVLDGALRLQGDKVMDFAIRGEDDDDDDERDDEDDWDCRWDRQLGPTSACARARL